MYITYSLLPPVDYSPNHKGDFDICIGQRQPSKQMLGFFFFFFSLVYLTVQVGDYVQFGKRKGCGWL